MIVAHFTRLTCEGCGLEAVYPDGRAPGAMPQHHFRGSFSTAIYTEPACIEYCREADEKERLRREAIGRKRGKLVAACATDPAFLALCAVYPNENGHGEDWGLLGDALERVADRIDVSTEQVAGSCSGPYHLLLADCITAARSAKLAGPGEAA